MSYQPLRNSPIYYTSCQEFIPNIETNSLTLNVDERRSDLLKKQLKIKKFKDDEYEFHSVLITGGFGFIGSNFLNVMVRKYPNVLWINIDCLHYASSEKNIEVRNYENYKEYRTNILNTSDINSILLKHNVDSVIHFAAKTHVDESTIHPFRYIENNIIGTFSLMEACRCYGRIQRFIYVSTDEVYGDNKTNQDIMDENSPIQPNNIYSVTKASAEMLSNAYFISFDFPVIRVRCNNVYGCHQYPEKLIPRFILLLINNKKCTIQGHGKQQRCFLHAYDVVNAYDIILRKGIIGEIYNIGSNNKYSVLDISTLLIKKIKNIDLKMENYDFTKNVENLSIFDEQDDLLNNDDYSKNNELNKWLSFCQDRPYNDQSYDISFDKIKKLGWKEEIPFSEGIQEVIDWYSSINVKQFWSRFDLFKRSPIDINKSNLQ